MSPPDFENPQRPETRFLEFDVNRVFFRVIRYWYLIVLNIFLFEVVAYLVNRYSTKIYSVEASILVKESEEVSGGEMLYNNPLIKFYRNYLNELYFIKSVPLIGKTVSDLEFEKSLFRYGDLKVSEVYKNLPISVHLKKKPKNQNRWFEFVLIDQNTFELKYKTDENEMSLRKSFYETIVLDSLEFQLIKKGDISDLLREKSKFGFQILDPQILAKSYIGRLKADWAEEGSGVINLSIRGSIPQKELDFLNKLIANYQQYDLEQKNSAASNAIRFINEQLDGITDSLTRAQNQLEAFKNKNVMTDLTAEAVRLYQKVETLELQKTELLVRGSYYDYLIEYIQKRPELDQVILPTTVGIEDPILISLISEMVQIQTELKLIARHDKLQNPVALEKERRMEELKSDILESVRNQKAVEGIRMNFLLKGIKEIDGQLRYLPVAERQLIDIKRNYALLDNLYTYLLQRRAESGISKATNISDVVIVNPPMVSAMIAPQSTRNYLLGLAGGLMLPVMIFLLLELFDNKVQSREDIIKLTSIPFVGGVGRKKQNQNLEVLNKPKSAISEAFRAVRSNLNYFVQGKQTGIFLITSSISGEGKTFTSINLASVFALSGKKTLIVGADMRRPKIFEDFGLDNSIGLSNYLAGMSVFKEVVRPTEFKDLDIVTGGPVPPNPSELILNNRMDEFLTEAKSLYDFIFIDSPPLNLVTDAFVLSTKVDHTLFIIRQNYTPKNLLRTIQDFYAEGKIKNVSLVLNDIYRSGPGYGYGYGYGYNYGYGYGYGNSKGSAKGYYEE